MRRGSPRIRPLTAAAVAVVALLLGVVPASARSDAALVGRKIVVTVPIDLIGGEDDIAEQWEHAIRNYWNDGPGLGRSRTAASPWSSSPTSNRSLPG
jgi:hypothetical protein